jgi:hypothetical protein
MPIGQTVVGGEIGERIAVETRYPLRRAKLEKSARVLFDLIDRIAEQAIGHRVGFYRKVDRADRICQREQKKRGVRDLTMPGSNAQGAAKHNPFV